MDGMIVAISHALGGLQGAASIATVAGVIVAVGAALVAVASLRSQAKSQQLEAIISTNRFWQDVTDSTACAITLSAVTITAIQWIYTRLMGSPDAAATCRDGPAREISMRVPYILGALLPAGIAERDYAPASERAYSGDMKARMLALGYVRSALRDPGQRPDWLSAQDLEIIKADLLDLDEAMTTWVNLMNEIAELYEGDLVDRRKFVGKRSVAIIQQLFVAEPYILWRNSTTPGRWGLRVLGLGAEARLYHWLSPLQRAGIRLRADPPEYQAAGTYPGYCAKLGWIIGPGMRPTNPIVFRWAEIRIRRGLGAGYRAKNKSRQNELIAGLPTSPDSGLQKGNVSWSDLLDDPKLVHDSVHSLRRP